jgi:hypothetical protein
MTLFLIFMLLFFRAFLVLIWVPGEDMLLGACVSMVKPATILTE